MHDWDGVVMFDKDNNGGDDDDDDDDDDDGRDNDVDVDRIIRRADECNDQDEFKTKRRKRRECMVS